MNNKKKKNNGYFQRNVQQNGPNFLNRKTPKDIKFDSRNIFKDIAHSNPIEDIPNIVEFFNNFTFVTNLYACAVEELNTNNAVYIGLQMYIAAGQRGEVYIDPSQKLYENMTNAQSKMCAYSIIVAHLNNILSLFNCSGDDDWLRLNIEQQLKSLSLQLSKYRRII